MSEEYFVREMFDLLQTMLFPLVGLFVLGIAAALLLAFCVYYDARSRRDRLAPMWAVLCGLFGSLVALVYVIVRSVSKPKPTLCVRCGRWVPPGYLFCSACGQPLLDNGRPVDPQELQKHSRRSRTLLIIWICVYVVLLVASIALMMYMVNSIFELVPDSVYYW